MNKEEIKIGNILNNSDRTGTRTVTVISIHEDHVFARIWGDIEPVKIPLQNLHRKPISSATSQ